MILEVPKIHDIKSFYDNNSEIEGKATKRKPPSKHIKSEFLDWADKGFDMWIEGNKNKSTKNSKEYQIFRIIEPIFRIKGLIDI